YLNIWLRDSCHCELCYHSLTKQRLLDTFAIPIEVKPKRVSIIDNVDLKIIWDDDHVSLYTSNFLISNSFSLADSNPSAKISNEDRVLEKRIYWNKSKILNEFPEVDYNDIFSSSESKSHLAIDDWIMKTFIYGFCFVNNVPVNPVDTEKLILKFSFIRETHYGKFWDFTANLKINDTAYTNLEIPLHTDGTYFSESPGLQVFHLLKHINGSGGETNLVDGFHCADVLKKNHPVYFKFLSVFKIPFHSVGDENNFIQPDTFKSIFEVNSVNNSVTNPRSTTPDINHRNEVIQVRWNNSDRSLLNLNLNYSGDYLNHIKSQFGLSSNLEIIDLFYKAIYKWNEIIQDDSNNIRLQLQPTKVLFFDNWRVFHSRTKFDGERRLCGAYLNRDDFFSKVKLISINRKQLLKEL
ncbi:Trimethyllysine dioxygenase, partial [Ascoidea rubescens DSM 1968]